MKPLFALDRLLASVERRCAKLQGKGWGAATVDHEVRQVARLLDGKPATLCIDIGGNKGAYSAALMAQFPAANIVVFEPSQVNVQILQDRFKDASQVSVEPYAVSKTAGDADLFSDQAGSGLGSLTKRDLKHIDLAFEASERIQTLRFETYWQDKLQSVPIDLCKLDVEGHELDALQGFGAAMAAIKVVQFEFGGANIDTRTYFRDFWHFFADHGFKLYRITPFGIAPIKRYHERHEAFVTTNYLAKRA